MRLDHLRLKNFRGFANFEVTLDPRMTVLVGDNAAGKTGLLEGAAVGLGGYLRGIRGAHDRHIRPVDVRRVVYEHGGLPDLQQQYPVEVSCRGTLDARAAAWTRTLTGPDGRTTRVRAKAIENLASRLQDQVRAGEPVGLPLLCYYGTQRLWLQHKETSAKANIGTRTDGYLDCLDPASNHRHLTAWVRKQALVAAQTGVTLPHFAAIEIAVCDCLQGAAAFWYDLQHEELRIRWQDGKLTSFDQLSDGYRNLVAMVADMAWRCAVLNPHLAADAARQTSGVVLIDEVDLHLHPRWQARVLDDLLRAFPLLQFVTTTHSPQVIATCRPEWIRVLEQGRERPKSVAFVHGWDSNSVLRGVMDADARPRFAQERLEAVTLALTAKRWEDAEKLIVQLAQDLGPADPEIVRAWLDLRFEKDMDDA